MKQTLGQTLSGLQLGYDQGGLIRLETAQWVTLPLNFSANCFNVIAEHQNSAAGDDFAKEWEVHEYQATRFWITANLYPCTLFWISFGK